MVIRVYDRTTFELKYEFGPIISTTQNKSVYAVGEFNVITHTISENIAVGDLLMASGIGSHEYAGWITDIESVFENGVMEFTIKGVELLGILTERMPFDGNTPIQTTPTVSGVIASLLVQKTMINAIDDLRNIPNLSIANNTNIGKYISYTVDPQKNVFENVVEICKNGEIVPEITVDFASKTYIFGVNQTKNYGIDTDSPVILSEKFDTLRSENYVYSTAAWKNVAYYGVAKSDATTYGQVSLNAGSGWERRERWIAVATDKTDEQIQSIIRMQLGNFKPVTNIAAEYSDDGMFKYGVHFNMGDTICYSGKFGVTDVPVTGWTQTLDSAGYTFTLTLGDNMSQRVYTINQILGGVHGN